MAYNQYNLPTGSQVNDMLFRDDNIYLIMRYIASMYSGSQLEVRDLYPHRFMNKVTIGEYSLSSSYSGSVEHLIPENIWLRLLGPSGSAVIQQKLAIGTASLDPTASAYVSGTVRISGGNPLPGRVLMAINNLGHAVWSESIAPTASLPSGTITGSHGLDQYLVRWKGTAAIETSSIFNDRGNFALVLSPYFDNQGTGTQSFVAGLSTIASGLRSFAFGNHLTASGQDSTAIGDQNIALGRSSHAEGGLTQAGGVESHAEGEGSSTAGFKQYRFQSTILEGPGGPSSGLMTCSFSDAMLKTLVEQDPLTGLIGNNITIIFDQDNTHTPLICPINAYSENGFGSYDVEVIGPPPFSVFWSYTGGLSNHVYLLLRSDVVGIAAHAEGVYATARGTGAHAEGINTTADGNYAHAEGVNTEAGNENQNVVQGTFDIVDNGAGFSMTASGDFSILLQSCIDLSNLLSFSLDPYPDYLYEVAVISYSVIGSETYFETTYPTIEPYFTFSSNSGSIVVSQWVGYGAHAEGIGTQAYGEGAHSQGYGTLAQGAYSFAGGDGTIAYGSQSVALGSSSIAYQTGSMVFGHNLRALKQHSFVFGTAVQGTLSNPFSHSLMIGFQTQSTLFIKDRFVGVNTTEDSASFHISGTFQYRHPTSLNNRALFAVNDFGLAEWRDTPFGSASLEGDGDGGFIPLWSGSYFLTSSIMYQNDSNKRIGIGTTSPKAKLDVRGTISGSSTASFEHVVSTANTFLGRVITNFTKVTGSLLVSGSGHFSGSLIVLSGITGSLFGTASWALNAVTASHAVNALSSSYAISASEAVHAKNADTASLATTASYVLNAVSASYALTSSYAFNAVSSSYALSASYAVSASEASHAKNADTASYALTASYVVSALTAISASYALTASYVLNAVSASYATTASYVLNAVSSSYALSSSYAATASYVLNAVSASYALSASYAVSSSKAVSSSYALSASYSLPAGSDTYVQFNDGGSFGGVSTFIYNKSTQRLGIGASPSEDLHVKKTTVGAATTIMVQNDDNTNASSDAHFRARVGGSSGGDPHLLLSVAGATSWAAGIDNSDDDAFVFSLGGNIGTGNIMRLSTANEVFITGSIYIRPEDHLFGTASWATNSISSSYAIYADLAGVSAFSLLADTASYATYSELSGVSGFAFIAASSSYALSSSWVEAPGGAGNDQQIIFNQLGNIGSSTTFYFVYSTNKLVLNGGTFQYIDGTEGAGKVLTSDAAGNASWVTPSGGPGGLAGAGVHNYIAKWSGSAYVTASTIIYESSGKLGFSTTVLNKEFNFNGNSEFTGSIWLRPSDHVFGTASWATSSLTASYVESASYALSSSFAVTASYALNARIATTASYALTASYVLNAVSASYATTSSFMTNDLVAIEYVMDGGGSVLSTGIKGDLEIPFNCIINRVTLLSDISGSMVVDIWKDTYANFPPTAGDSITAAAKPTITTNTKYQDSTLTAWTASIAAGDILRFNIDSCTSITRAVISLKATKT